MARKDPRLQRRGTTWHLRVKVPDAIRAAGLIKQREFRKSLHTSDYAEACRLARIEGIEVDQQISAARAKLSGAPLRVLAQSELRYFAQRWFAKTEERRLASPSTASHDDDDPVEAWR